MFIVFFHSKDSIIHSMKIFIISAISADGFIAKDPIAPSTSWTSAEDKKHFSEITKRAGVIVMGAKTFATIGRALPGRKTIVYSNTPINVTGIETTSLAPAELIKQLEQEGFKEVAICGGTTIYTMFMKAGVVDSLYLTIEPVIFGSGIPLFKETLDIKMELLNFEKRGQSIFAEYKIV